MILTQEQFNGIPDWVNFLAIDSDLELWGYEHKPRIGYSSWVSDEREDEKTTFLGICTEYSDDWKASLIERQKA